MKASSTKIDGKRYARKDHEVSDLRLSASLTVEDPPGRLQTVSINLELDDRHLRLTLDPDEAARLAESLKYYLDKYGS